MTKATDGDSPEKALPRSMVSTLRLRLSRFFGVCRQKLSTSLTSSKSHAGELLQVAGVAATMTGVFFLWGMAVGLVISGLVAVGVGTLHESGRL